MTVGRTAAAELPAVTVCNGPALDAAHPASTAGLLTLCCATAEAADKGCATLSGSGWGGARAGSVWRSSSSGGTERPEAEPGSLSSAR